MKRLKPVDPVIAAFAIAIVALVGIIAWVAHRADNDWDMFSRAHHCVLVSTSNDNAINTIGISPKGNLAIGVGVIPGKNGYKCDDGIVYYRDR